MLYNSRRYEDGRAGQFGLTFLSLRVEWAFDLDVIQFGLQTGLDKGAGVWYVKGLFGPFQAAFMVVWGGMPRLNPEDRPQNKAKGEVPEPPKDGPA